MGDVDTSHYETGNIDTSRCETGSTDTSCYETGNIDMSCYETGNVDTSRYEMGNVDTSRYEMGNVDTSRYEMGNVDMSRYEMGNIDTSRYETGNVDTSYYETGNIDTYKCKLSITWLRSHSSSITHITNKTKTKSTAYPHPWSTLLAADDKESSQMAEYPSMTKGLMQNAHCLAGLTIYRKSSLSQSWNGTSLNRWQYWYWRSLLVSMDGRKWNRSPEQTFIGLSVALWRQDCESILSACILVEKVAEWT